MEREAGVSEQTANQSVKHFCKWLVGFRGEKWLGTWSNSMVEKEIEINAERGFPGMFGSIDCTHWEWKLCPIALQGQYQGKEGEPTLVTEAVAGSDMYFYHAHVGEPGSLNDLNVLDRSTLQVKYVKSATARHELGSVADKEYEVNGKKYRGLYFLADGIYPSFACFVKTLPQPNTTEKKNFAARQESVRKDVERAFGRLLAKWHILDHPARGWSIEYLRETWTACIILHNMTLKDSQEGGYSLTAEMADDIIGVEVSGWESDPEPEENGDDGFVECERVSTTPWINAREGGINCERESATWTSEALLEGLMKMQSRSAHDTLGDDLIEHQWKFKKDLDRKEKKRKEDELATMDEDDRVVAVEMERRRELRRCAARERTAKRHRAYVRDKTVLAMRGRRRGRGRGTVDGGERGRGGGMVGGRGRGRGRGTVGGRGRGRG